MALEVRTPHGIVSAMAEIPNNDLWLVVLPMVHLAVHNYGSTEEVITFLPDKNFATAFFPDEVENYVRIVKNRTKHLIGGHVTGYSFHEEETGDGRLYVRVVQIVEQ